MCFVRMSKQTATFVLYSINRLVLYNRNGLFTARYALSPYVKQIRFVFKGLISTLDVMDCQRHLPAFLPPERAPVAGWTLGKVRTGAGSLAASGVQTPNPLAPSEELCGLRYPGPQCTLLSKTTRDLRIDCFRVVNVTYELLKTSHMSRC
jgi:hypothetical protein